MDLSKIKRSDLEKKPECITIKKFISDNLLDLDWVSNYKQVIYHYVNNIKLIPKCRCGKSVNFKSYRIGYRKNCSPKCSADSDETKDKLKKSKIEKYGDPNYNNAKKMMSTKMEKYGNCSYNNREKAVLTNLERYGCNTPTKNEKVKEKTKLTKLERYGLENYNNIEKIKKFWSNINIDKKNEFVRKIKQSKLDLYGDENFNNSSKMLKTKRDSGILRDDLDHMNWIEYRNRVRTRTNSKRKKLFESWDGLDFYTGEEISENLKKEYFDHSYPTVDHKIPIIVCFNSGVSVEEASSLDNLCITTRIINSLKREMTSEEFFEKMNTQKL